jgi:ABC-2 type transport system permease protein
MTATETRTRFRDLLAAEWIKLWSLRSTYGVPAVGALICVGITTNSARSNVALISRSTNPLQRLAIDPMNAAFVTEAFQILGIIACSVGAITVFGEYATGLIHTTFTAVPARRQVVAAKVIVVTAVMLVFGALVSAASFGLTQAIYHEHRIGLSISAPGALRAVAASALLAPLCALVGMALGAVIRHAAGTVVAAIGLLLLLPALFQGETYRWVKEIGNAMPYTAWQALIENPARHEVPGHHHRSVDRVHRLGRRGRRRRRGRRPPPRPVEPTSHRCRAQSPEDR